MLAYSPCPNDTFIFHAWVHGLVAGAPAVEERLEDIDTLNGLALEGWADVVKVSMYAFARLRGRVRAAAFGRRDGARVRTSGGSAQELRLAAGADRPPGDGLGRRAGARPGGCARAS